MRIGIKLLFNPVQNPLDVFYMPVYDNYGYEACEKNEREVSSCPEYCNRDNCGSSNGSGGYITGYRKDNNKDKKTYSCCQRRGHKQDAKGSCHSLSSLEFQEYRIYMTKEGRQPHNCRPVIGIKKEDGQDGWNNAFYNVPHKGNSPELLPHGPRYVGGSYVAAADISEINIPEVFS